MQRFKLDKNTPKEKIKQELDFIKAQGLKYMFWQSKDKSYNIDLIN